jgi:membrane dipeptidase
LERTGGLLLESAEGEASQKPVLVTHSNCRALVPNRRRCQTDELIKKMAVKGGVMGITLIRSFVSARGPTTIEHALDHIDRVARLSGVEHIGNSRTSP